MVMGRGTHDVGEEGTGNTLVEDVVPVGILEEEVRLDLGGISLARTESTDRVASEELCVAIGRSATALSHAIFFCISTHLLQNRHAVLGHVNGVQRLVLENGIEDLILVVSAEGRLTEQHLVDEDSKRPPIDGTTVALLEDDLFDEMSSVLAADRKKEQH